jgi:hypothetical protein
MMAILLDLQADKKGRSKLKGVEQYQVKPTQATLKSTQDPPRL